MLVFRLFEICVTLLGIAQASYDQIRLHVDVENQRVAIIGSGPAGSLAAFSLAQIEQRYDLPRSEITIYERNDYVGGRVDYLSVKGHAIELGASIFVPKNRILDKAARVFNLSLQSGHGEAFPSTMAIYDGQRFVYEQSGWTAWDYAKMFWSYGMSPLRAQKLMKNMLGLFVKQYTDGRAFESINEWIDSLEMTDLVSQTAQQYLQSNGVSAAFIDDILSAGSSVNYANTMRRMHALEGLVSIAAEGASSVIGGNRQIFERFVKHSQAELHLSAPVTSVSKIQRSESTYWNVSTASDWQIYDTLVLAAPLQQTGITFHNTDAASKILKTEYVHLFVTLVVTDAVTPQACFFNPEWPCDRPAPRAVYTTLAPFQMGKVAHHPRINSLNYIKELPASQWIVKLFSMQELTDQDLAQAFGPDNVLQVFRKDWLSYPHAPPTKEFSPIRLDDGLYYANSMEAAISTMETEAIAGWNIARLIVQDRYNTTVDGNWATWD